MKKVALMVGNLFSFDAFYTKSVAKGSFIKRRCI